MAQSQARAVARRDAVVVDPQHYRVESENDRVRVLRCGYGPHEKSVMHTHGPHVVVCLSDARFRFTFPDGRTEEKQVKAGDTLVMEATEHLPENLSDRPFEVIVIELKG